MSTSHRQSANVVRIPYTPRPLQAELHKAMTESRWSVVVCHRRFGKTVMAINHLLRDAITCQRPNARFYYLAPTYKQAKSIAWGYVKEFCEKIPKVKFNETELRCDLPNGSRLQLLGADDGGERLRGLYCDGIVIDEVADIGENVFPEIIRPALSDRKGGGFRDAYCIFIGTPKGHNAFYELYEQAKQKPTEWFVSLHKASQTQVLPYSELTEAKSMMSESQYAQEFECSFLAAIPGAIYGAEMEKAQEENRITRVPIDMSRKVHTAWDLGVNDATSVWMYQQIGHAIHLVDYLEARNEGLPYYVSELARKKYLWGRHFAPHDIEVRELGSGKSRREIAYELGLDFITLPKLPLEDGIHNAQVSLSRCYFDYDNCKRGIEALRQYHRSYNDKTRVFAASPKRTWATHGADAFRYLCMSLRDHDDFRKPMAPFADNKYNPLGREVFA